MKGAIFLLGLDVRILRFNSRTREGCDRERAGDHHAEDVSIHAPVKGAIRATTPGPVSASFNSRTREGCDDAPGTRPERLVVSIHAPVKGAMNTLTLYPQPGKFQFTHP